MVKFSDHGLALIIIGLILTISVYLFFLGIPLIIIGAYFLNKKANQDENEINEKLKDKNKELANIDNKLKEKENQFANLDVEFEKRAAEKDRKIDAQLRDKKEDLANIDNTLREIEEEMAKELSLKFKEKETQLANLNNELNEKKKGLIFVDDALEMQEVGLYQPKYDFLTAVSYKEKWDEIRQKQKEHIKNKTAAICETEWRVDDSIQKGRAMTNANIKQILRNFNLDCEMAISKVKISNRENSVKRIRKSFETLNKLNERNAIKITPQYLDLKLQELDVAIEYELKKQEEKELLREAREQEREERKIQKQLDAEEKRINAQKKKLENDLNKIGAELRESSSDEEKEKLKLKIRELELALAKSNDDIEQIADRRKRTGAGYVYILSNIGSFGEDVYKIGVTRRDEPQDRVRELSNASVPFKFDSHVFIFSKEAFELEKDLHNRFDHKRVNKVNSRKEFFNITYDDVKTIVEENKELVHSFTDKPEAQEYYDTLKIEKMSSK
ncbi:DUF4041 domain-containing protein [Methanobacterium alkalithermotolerans]|uniref:DUF4041 domain-containing protein n=1 Tax=Methanobacterium alkalithermotolerans TaxID=2731220 RepID=A0A8T8K5Z5_9EURY|nr:DUF4041 domain-containing protein [Methanobacterium alkalithermotolerans]QUH22520.1 DUF4041 domain-containing protein [Methanobacterium alkalithermotolerans]